MVRQAPTVEIRQVSRISSGGNRSNKAGFQSPSGNSAGGGSRDSRDFTSGVNKPVGGSTAGSGNNPGTHGSRQTQTGGRIIGADQSGVAGQKYPGGKDSSSSRDNLGDRNPNVDSPIGGSKSGGGQATDSPIGGSPIGGSTTGRSGAGQVGGSTTDGGRTSGSPVAGNTSG